jgi:hypothetical protein
VKNKDGAPSPPRLDQLDWRRLSPRASHGEFAATKMPAVVSSTDRPR